MGSFRQLLLVAFLLIAALLGATALRAVGVLEQLVERSAEEASRALALHGAAQAIAARSAAMERAGRQSLVLNDAVLRRRFYEELRAARGALQQAEGNGLRSPDPKAWRTEADGIAALLDGPVHTALDREANVAAAFRELDTINARILAQVQAGIEAGNAGLREQLDASRRRLLQVVLAAIALAIGLALAFGIWLARPFQRLEKAIVGLGENRLDTPIDIPGPTDVRNVGQQLEWLRLRLAALDADKARFLRHVSHELKTPLAALREGVSLLQEGVAGPLNGNQQEVVQILHQNALALQGQIEALLRFNAAAFEAGRLQRRRTDLLQLLREQVEAQRLQSQARGLTVRLAGEPRWLPVDAEKLGTAVANLLSNAIRFSPAGGTIDIALSDGAAGVCIDLRDQGPGVADTDRDRVFEPFYRGERQPEGAVRGTGIGLSIVREYVAAHGGRVRLVPGNAGGHFQIELPHAT